MAGDNRAAHRPACAARFSGRLDSAPMVLSLPNPGQRPSLLCAGFDRLAPEGRRAVATGGARFDDSRAKRNPWFPGPSPYSPGRGDSLCRPCRGDRGFSPLFHGFRVGGGDSAATTLHPWLQSYGPFGAKYQASRCATPPPAVPENLAAHGKFQIVDTCPGFLVYYILAQGPRRVWATGPNAGEPYGVGRRARSG